MKANFHTHSTFCDGKNTPEDMVLHALENNFDAIGFSGHYYTPFDLRYCMKDTEGYIAEIQRLKEKYKGEIQIYLGVEEDVFHLCDRERYDYVIGSSHYLKNSDGYTPVDSNYDYFSMCFDFFGRDPLAFAEHYLSTFCDYILARRPDIIGHFDYVTKFDEVHDHAFLNNQKYIDIAKKYTLIANKSGSIFEVNTGGMARALRTSPYPQDVLLYELKKDGGKLILSSDCHDKDLLDFGFDDTKKYLRDIGFRQIYTLYDGKFKPENL